MSALPDWLPPAFASRMVGQLGPEASAFFAALEQESPVSIRLHPRKRIDDFDAMDPVPWCPQGRYLRERPSFQLDPCWHAGAYYVQEASSMVIDEVLRQLPRTSPSMTWLDLCAAPGGKTGILAKHMQAADILVANEVVSGRRNVLAENLVKGGYGNVALTGLPAGQFDEPFVDLMLIDAPCAGEGMMRKDPEAVRQWNPGLVESCSLLQHQILHQAIRALRPGGHLIYSTCSYSEAENMENALRLAGEFELESVPVLFPDTMGISLLGQAGVTGYQLYPHRVRGEGLFFTVLRRPDGSVRSPGSKRKARPTLQPVEVPKDWKNWVKADADILSWADGDRTCLVSREAFPLYEQVLKHLAGHRWLPEAGIRKGKDLVPAHWLAMSPWVSPDVPRLELAREQSLDYLERKIPADLPAAGIGWHLATFRGIALGWMKHTNQGWRNHYPAEWRLRYRPGTP